MTTKPLQTRTFWTPHVELVKRRSPELMGLSSLDLRRRSRRELAGLPNLDYEDAT